MESRLNGFNVSHGSNTTGIVRVQLNGNFSGFLNGLNKIVGIVGLQQTGHIFDTNRMGTHILQRLGVLGKLLQTVEGTGGIAHTGLGVSTLLDTSLNSGFNIPGIRSEERRVGKECSSRWGL